MNKEQKKNESIIVIRSKRKSNEVQKKRCFDRYSTGSTKEKGIEYER